MRQNDENRLRDFLRQMQVMHLPPSDGINEIDMPRHQRGKRFLRILARVIAHQFHVIGDHLPIHLRKREKGTVIFAQGRQRLEECG
ncbi:MAG: hypothetical protein ACLQSR_14765 [Limisphaerales bacterium]